MVLASSKRGPKTIRHLSFQPDPFLSLPEICYKGYDRSEYTYAPSAAGHPNFAELYLFAR